MPRSPHGGRHELGQNFLTHRPTIDTISALVAATAGPVLELGAGDGALTRVLAASGRRITAIDIDEDRVRRLARALPGVTVVHADALLHPITAPVVVGNIPFHLTTPILRRLLNDYGWSHAVLVTQWEVARKRAGVGGGTMLTAQSAPWFEFELCARVPSWGFAPRPSVEGGVLTIHRRDRPWLRRGERRRFESFVRAVFTGSGKTIDQTVQRAARVSGKTARAAVIAARVQPGSLPRDLGAEHWAGLWRALRL